MTILFILSMVMSSMSQYINTPSNQCQTLTDMFKKAKYDCYHGNLIESYRLFYQLETSHHFKESSCAWYQIQCLIQLGHWRHAITKCHEWNKKQPKEATWYLLASDIYLDKLDFHLAWEELFKASVRVPTTHHDYDEILFKKRMAFEAIQRISAPRHDILTVLPYDVVCDIFLCLDLESLVRCTRVSSQWRQLLLSSSHLWNELQFSKKAAQLKMTTIDTYLGRLKRSSLTTLSIQHQHMDGDGILMTLAKHECYRLKTLVLSDIICTPTLFFNALEYIGSTLHTFEWGGVSIRLNDIMDNLPNICKQLKTLVVHDCFTSLSDAHLHNGALYRLEHFGESFPKEFLDKIRHLPTLNHLESLELTGIHGLTASHLANILIRCPNLKRLKLKRCLVNIIPILNILRWTCPKLQYVEYQRNRYCQQFDHFLQQREQNNRKGHVFKKEKEFPWIELKIQLTNTLTDSIIQDLLLDHSLLQVLDIQKSSFLSDQSILSAKQMTSLQTMCFKECFGFTAKGIQQFILQCPLLKHVDLSCLTVINNDILIALSKCQHLMYLNLSYCKLDSISFDIYKLFIDKRCPTLKRVVLDYSTHLSMDLHLYTIKKIKRGII